MSQVRSCDCGGIDCFLEASVPEEDVCQINPDDLKLIVEGCEYGSPPGTQLISVGVGYRLFRICYKEVPCV